MIIRLPLISRTIILRKPVKIIKTRKIRAQGFDSRTQDGKHVIFLDYDEVLREIALDDIKCLQVMCGLSTFYVFATKPEKEETYLDAEGKPHKVVCGNYHAIALDKFNLFEANLIIRQAGAVDYAFKRGAYLDMSRSWTLRTKKDYRPKPEYILSIIPGNQPNPGREQSSAHAEYLRRNYGVPVKLENPDGLKFIWSESYLTKQKEG